MASRSQLKRQAEVAVNRWNKANPVGTAVVFVFGGLAYQTTTTSAAELVDGHHPMVALTCFPHSMFLHSVWRLSPTVPQR